MRFLVLLFFLLAGCETFGDPFGWGQITKGNQNLSYCNIPLRLRVIRTSAEYCDLLGGHRVDESEVDELEAHYQSLNSS